MASTSSQKCAGSIIPPNLSIEWMKDGVKMESTGAELAKIPFVRHLTWSLILSAGKGNLLRPTGTVRSKLVT